ncbi:MAG TPA: alpha/beta hydrolase [Acidimicrobiia bacterium]|nr:alpha/beta hydrolase [Acidimicrobiia bacterium]
MTTTAQKTGYLPIGELEMYYEVHGSGLPLVLLHGAFSATGTSFGAMLPGLAEKRQVISFEMQGHGHTADIDRPLSVGAMADDVVAGIRQMGIEPTDLLGYSTGAAVAIQATLNAPELIRKLVTISVTITLAGVQPGLLEGVGEMKPEMMYGSPWHDEYLKIAPRPDDFNQLFEKKAEMDRNLRDVPADDYASIKSPTLIILGDSDLPTLDHAVEMFRLRGGGVFGDLPAGLPDSQLAVIPGASHVSVVSRQELLVPMINSFLDAPMPASKA